MKIRYGFVSNSSSSSFIIHKKDLNDEQIEKIKECKLFKQKYDSWSIYEDDEEEREDGREAMSISIPSDTYDPREFLFFIQYLENLGIKASQIQEEDR